MEKREIVAWSIIALLVIVMITSFFVVRYFFIEIAENVQDMIQVESSTKENLETRYFEALLNDEDFELGLHYPYLIGYIGSADNTLLFRNNQEDSATFFFTLTANESVDSYYSADDVEIYFVDSNDDWSDEYELESGEDIELRFVAVPQVSKEEIEEVYENHRSTALFPNYIVEVYMGGDLYATESMVASGFYIIR